jgi:hypothetical protein
MTYHNNALQDCFAIGLGFSQSVPTTADIGDSASAPNEPLHRLILVIFRLQYFRKPVSQDWLCSSTSCHNKPTRSHSNNTP